MSNRSKRVMMVLGLIAALAIPVGCGGGSSGGTGGVACTTTLTGLDGVNWIYEETDTLTGGGGGCAANAPISVPGCTVVQNQTQLTVTIPGDGTSTVQVCGNTITTPADSYAENGGTTTEAAYTMTWNGTNAFTGTSTWVWTGAGGPCNGTTDYVFRR